MTQIEDRKEYLGDGVYAAFDGYHIVLTTEDGVTVLNKIFLEPEVMSNLRRYEDRLIEHIKEVSGE